MEPHSRVLLEALGIDCSRRGVIALVGGGGKTSLMWALAREFVGRRRTVVTSTTTRILPPQPSESPSLVLLAQDFDVERLREKLSVHGQVTLAQSLLPNGKLEGISEEVVELCARHADWVIVEADGAAGRPIKAPEAWEPVIPRRTSLVIPVIGLDSLGKLISRDVVFRLERFIETTNAREHDPITPPIVARLLLSDRGARKGVPAPATVTPVLNKLDLLPDMTPVQEIVHLLAASGAVGMRRVVASSLKPAVRAVVFPIDMR